MGPIAIAACVLAARLAQGKREGVQELYGKSFT